VYEALNLRGVEFTQNRKAKNRLTNEVLIIANALYTLLALAKARFTERWSNYPQVRQGALALIGYEAGLNL